MTTTMTRSRTVGQEPTGASQRAHDLLPRLTAVAAAALGTWLLVQPSVLLGPPGPNGSARGTGAVLLALAAPTILVTSLPRGRRTAPVGTVVLAGALAFVVYNGLMLTLATPFNRTFPLAAATLGLAGWGLGQLLALRVDTDALVERLAPAPARGVALWVGAVASLNAVAWLGQVLRGLGDPAHAAFLDGTGLVANVVHVQDLTVWLPASLLAAALLWRRHPWGYVLGGAVVVMLTLEGAAVAVDQLFAVRADPSTPTASAAAVPAFAVLGAVELVVAWLLLRDRGRDVPLMRRRVAGAAMALVAVSAVGGAASLVSPGQGLGELTARLPFGSAAVGALALLVLVAAPLTAAAATAWRGSPRAGLTTTLAGVLLVVWIVVELAFLRELSILHPLVAVTGLALAVAGRQGGPTPAS